MKNTIPAIPDARTAVKSAGFKDAINDKTQARKPYSTQTGLKITEFLASGNKSIQDLAKSSCK